MTLKNLYQPLYSHIYNNYSLHLSNNEMDQIIRIATKVRHALINNQSIEGNKFSNDYITQRTDEIINKICLFYDVSFEELKKACRKPKMVRARAFIYYFLFTELKLFKAEIGRIFNNCHSTVIHTLQGLEYKLDDTYDYKEYRDEFDQLKKILINNLEL